MKLNLDNLKKALESMEATLEIALNEEFMSSQIDIVRNAIKSGLIQNFEFTYELCWKALQRWLEINVGSQQIDSYSKKELFRLAVEKHLIDDAKKWFSYNEARNLTSHTYDVTTSDKVFTVASFFVEDARNLLTRLEEKND